MSARQSYWSEEPGQRGDAWWFGLRMTFLKKDLVIFRPLPSLARCARSIGGRLRPDVQVQQQQQQQSTVRETIDANCGVHC